MVTVDGLVLLISDLLREVTPSGFDEEEAAA